MPRDDQLLSGERSVPGPSSQPFSPRKPPRTSLARRWKAWKAAPGTLLAVGLALLAVGAGLVATPLAINAARSAPQPPPPPAPPLPAGVNSEGVPVDALGDEVQQGELADCRVQLGDRPVYEASAQAAEAALFGGAPAAALPRPQLQRAVGGLPSLLFGTVFWVLVSPAHPWAPEFEPAAAAQVEVLNAAFRGLGMRFRLDAVLAAPAANSSSPSARAGSGGGGEDEGRDGGADAVVKCCLERWAELEAQLVPAAGRAAAGGGGAGVGADAGGDADPPAIHVILCEPEGANGAAAVLGDGTVEGGGARGSILLRRGALWQSRTSLVHQLGHFLGLPHPFPDEGPTCKVDGDGVADTPQQYAPNTSCEEDGDDMHVCPAARDGPVAPWELPVPVVNHMDLTPDACRRHFTLGQAARMQAMLRSHRPRLFAAASSPLPQPQAALQFEGTWQSGLAPAAVRQQQLEAPRWQALHGAAAAAGGPGSGRAAAPALLSLDTWQHAALAADDLLSTAPQDCACLGADSAGRVFWTGELNASYPIAAVRLVLPAQVGGAGGAGAGDSTQASSGSGEPAAGPASAAPAPSAEPSAAAAATAGVLLDIRVGDSLDPSRNRPCSQQPLRLPPPGQPLAEVACGAGVAGRYVSVAAAAQQQQERQQAVCLCEVQALTALAHVAPPAGPGSGGDGDALSARLPAVALNLTDAAANQSSTRASGASAALATWPPAPGAQPCSSTQSEGAPWWSLDAGLDGAWVRGVRLSVPFACQRAGGECVPAAPANLTVYVGDVPPAELLAAAHGPPGAASSSFCAAGVAALRGQPVEIDCGRYMQGRYITVVAASGAQPAPLSLCGVRLLGAAELPLSQRMRQAPAGLATGMAALSVSPAALQPEASLPIGSAAADSCLVAPAAAAANGSTSWELRLDGSYQLLAVRLAATPAAAAAPANNTRLAVSLLDTGGGLVAAWPVPPGSPGGMTLELPAATHAAAMRVQGFASLCQVQLLAASQLPSKSYALAPLPAGGMQGAAGRWQVLDAATGQPPAASSGGGGGDGGAALFDSMAGTCISVRPAWAAAGGSGSALGQLAGLEVQLDRPLRLSAVQLVAGGLRASNVSIAAAPPLEPGAARAGFAAAWASAQLCEQSVELHPWQPALATCRQERPLLTDRLLIRLEAAADGTGEAAAGPAGVSQPPGAASSEPAAGTAAPALAGAEAVAAAGVDPPELMLCELSLHGLPAMPDA